MSYLNDNGKSISTRLTVVSVHALNHSTTHWNSQGCDLTGAGVKESLLVATGDGDGEGVNPEKSSNLFGEWRRWVELPGSGGVSYDSTPKLHTCIFTHYNHLICFHCIAYHGASGVTAGGGGLAVM